MRGGIRGAVNTQRVHQIYGLVVWCVGTDEILFYTKSISMMMKKLTKLRPILMLVAALFFAETGALHAQEKPQKEITSIADLPVIPAEPASATTLDDGVRYRELTRGIYEVIYNPHNKLLYVASALSSEGVSGGVIYILNPENLEPVGAIYTDLRNFGLALSPDGKKLFATNSVEHSITAFDLDKNQVIGRLSFDNKDKDGYYFGPRQIKFDARKNRLYVGAVGDPAVIWVVNPETMKLEHTIENTGKWMTGLMIHPQTGDLYAANGGGEILKINTDTYAIENRFKPAGNAEALLLNMALDEKKNQIYVTDNSKLKTTLIVDALTGAKVGEVPLIGDSLGILRNDARGEIYISQRDQATVSILDADTLAVKRRVPAPPHPNSLALSEDGKTLFVTVKTPFTPTYKASAVESIIRIPLAE